MSEDQTSGTDDQALDAEQRDTMLFAQLVIQQTNMAMMLLGKIAHPESGKVHRDIEAARLFIDQLEMLETKTKGNLNKDESGLLKQSLMSLRLAFVEAVDTSESGSTSSTESKPEPAAAGGTEAAPASTSSGQAEEEHRKKFSKKY